MNVPQCEQTGKLMFASRAAAARSRQNGRNKGRKMRVYQCEHCHRFHLSSEVYSR